MSRVVRLLAGLLLIVAVTGAWAFETREFADNAQERRYYALLGELRCLVCQNQSLADSNAGLAIDLRNQVYAQLRAGSRDEEIIDYLVARYGDFVLYRPPLDTTTVVLWAGPAMLVVAGLAMLWRQVRRNNAIVVHRDLDARERERLAGLLERTRKDPT
ncbi:MAG: cytochrome c-type biogenesis protein CcmH [Gammaproteobacteria bacterium]|nr:cytochrome c-type biogenesis protein CcmH [Gammaproteobacteria bacterium]